MKRNTTEGEWRRPRPRKSMAGLASYDEAAWPYFNGRSAEIEELTRRIVDEPLTVLFGRSGLGKSSLLKAGVFPRLRELGFVPIYIRLHFRDAQLGLTEQVRAYFEQELREQRIEYPTGPPTSRCGSSSPRRL